MLYVAIAAMASKYVHPYAFLVMTSYMHYSMYIATYAQKTNVAFGLFKRNVVFYKTLALLQLAYYYLTNFQYDPTSLAMIAVGYGISTSAAIALGVDRTYFGVELGKAPFADTLVFIIEIPLPYQSCCVSRVRTL
eukprot:3402449-Pyramimonas_sp.AAC.2